MEWEKSDRSIDILEYYAESFDRLTEKAWDQQPDSDLWIIPPRGRSVVTSIQNYRKKGFDQLPVYEERCRNSSWEISHLEQEFEIDLDGILVKGAIDRLLFYPNIEEYLLEDVKSGNVGDDEVDYRQLGFYAMVARELWNIPVHQGRYWFTKVDRGSAEKDLSQYDKKFWVDQFNQLDKGISEGVFLASPGGACGICSAKPWCSTQGWLKVGEDLK